MKNAKIKNQMSDDENPDLMFQMVATDLLLQIANGQLDAKKLVKNELANRGLGKFGTWVGFDKAKEVWRD